MLRPDLGLYVVLDGVGGHAAGDLAAALAAEAMQRFYEDGGTVWPLDAKGPADDPQARLVAAAKLANARIRAQVAHEPEKRGMGAAFAAVYLGGSGYCIAHAGHCRVYRFREDRLECLTEDHRGLHEYLRRGVPLDIAERRPDKNALSRALGLKEKVEVSSHLEDVRPGDVVLVVSNGIYDVVVEPQIAQVIAAWSGADATANELIRLAQAHRSGDDTTCILLRWSADTTWRGGQ